MSTLHFLHPGWLAGIPAVVALLVALYLHGRRNALWESVCDAHLLAALLEPAPRGSVPAGLLVAGLAACLALFALAGPAWTRAPGVLHQPELTRVVLLDLSRSMDATDVSPSRLTLAKLKLRDVLAQSSARTALVAFAGEPFVIAPLTDDAQTIAAMVTGLSTDILPVQGTATGAAIDMAHTLLERDGAQRGEVLLISDLADLDGAARAAARRLAPHMLSVLVVGERGDGAILHDAKGEPLRWPSGEPVRSITDWHAAEAIASGRVAALSDDGSDVKSLLGSDDGRGRGGADEVESDTLDWRDEGPWFVLLALPLVGFAMRRGWFLAGLTALAVTTSMTPPPALAAAPSPLWNNADQRGAAAYAAGDFAAAARRFEDPRWRALARHRAGDLAGALQDFARTDDAASMYNHATVLAGLGRLEEALVVYDELLRRYPDHGDGAYNRAIVASVVQTLAAEQAVSTSSLASDFAASVEAQVPAPRSDEGSIALNDESPQGGDSPMDRSGSMAPPEDAALAAAPSEDPSYAGAAGGAGQDEADGGGGNNRSGADSTGYSGDGQRARTSGAGGGGDVDLDAEGISHGERRQALEQWLRRIPDDPSGLIRRKLALEYKRRLRDRAGPSSPEEAVRW